MTGTPVGVTRRTFGWENFAIVSSVNIFRTYRLELRCRESFSRVQARTPLLELSCRVVVVTDAGMDRSVYNHDL